MHVDRTPLFMTGASTTLASYAHWKRVGSSDAIHTYELLLAKYEIVLDTFRHCPLLKKTTGVAMLSHDTGTHADVARCRINPHTSTTKIPKRVGGIRF